MRQEHLRLDPHIGEDMLLDEPLTTKEGWARFVGHRPGPPPVAADIDDETRIDYLSELVMVNTPTIAEVTACARRLVMLNRHQVSARRSLMVTGIPGTGKTTAITALGRIHELAVRRRHPARHDRLPVIYVTVPPAATPRMLAVEFTRFLGLPVSRAANLTDVVNAVCATAVRVHVELVLVDEIHNISLATRSGAEVSDQLKYFAERMPATFVYAGVDVERAGLFAGPRGRQIASRFTTIPAAGFPYGTEQQRAAWRALVAAVESTLPLRAHPAGTLAGWAEYLHRRTNGMIGSLSHLVRGAAIDAILDGAEQVTRPHLEAIRLDHAAESTHSPRPPACGLTAPLGEAAPVSAAHQSPARPPGDDRLLHRAPGPCSSPAVCGVMDLLEYPAPGRASLGAWSCSTGSPPSPATPPARLSTRCPSFGIRRRTGAKCATWPSSPARAAPPATTAAWCGDCSPSMSSYAPATATGSALPTTPSTTAPSAWTG